MHRPLASRDGFSLIEVAAAAAILGMVAAMAVSVARFSSLAEYGAKSDARELANQLRLAQSRTIATGRPHRMQLRFQGGDLVGYQLAVDLHEGERLVGDYRRFSRGVRVQSSHRLPPEFTFEGDAVRTQFFRIRGAEHDVRVSVEQAGGVIQVRDVSRRSGTRSGRPAR